MRKSYVTIYDLQMRKVAMLENAFGIQYEMPMNALWTASFRLPADDPKNVECQPMYFAEIFDESERIELFRIMPSALRRNSNGSVITYQCEHVLGTLLDDILFQYHTIGNLGVYTDDVLRYILQRQSVQRWQLGTVEFNHQFEYNWENENLLAALFSVPKPFVDEYMWTWDTTAYPWVLNLVRPSSEVQAYIRYGVNMQGIERTIDPSNVVTRIYGLGYGEGVNQLTFAEINGGKPYLDAEPEYIQKYGLMQTVFVDRRFEYPETLLARCRALLDELKQPRVTYVVQASELYHLTKDPLDKFRTGAMVRVQDQEIGEDVTFRVLNVRKQDVLGQPGNVEIEIANRPQDIAGSIAELRNRMHINEVYAQGATNFDSHDFQDNCDPEHPAVLRFYIPEETVRINKVRLSYQVEAFRAYSRAIKGGGAVVTSTKDGGGRTITSKAGGADTVTSEEGGRWIDTTEDGGAVENTFTAVVEGGKGIVYSEEKYTHGGPGDHQHRYWDSSVDEERLLNHRHRIVIGPHKHGINIPSHSHTVRLPNHSHEIELPNHSHEITIPGHTHEIEHGIFEGPMPTAVTVRVDGRVVPGLGTSATDVDIVPYLSKDDGGRISRGTWHTIEIVPNNLGRIVATVTTQIFVQSRGGGNY